MIVIDNFIKDPAFLKQLEENKKQLFSDNGATIGGTDGGTHQMTPLRNN